MRANEGQTRNEEKNMKRLVGIVFAVLLALNVTGCFTSAVYKDSKQKVAMRQAILSNNQVAIKAIKLGDDGIGVGINILAWDVIREQPVKLTGAAVLDILLTYAGYEGVKYLTDDFGNDDRPNDSSNNQDSGRDSTQITINTTGNENATTVHVGEETFTTTYGE